MRKQLLSSDIKNGQIWLDTVEGDKKAYFNRIIQFSSHSRLSNEEIAEPTEPEKQTVKLLLDNLTNNYGTWPKQEEQHG